MNESINQYSWRFSRAVKTLSPQYVCVPSWGWTKQRSALSFGPSPAAIRAPTSGNKDEHLETSHLLYHSKPGTIISHEPQWKWILSNYPCDSWGPHPEPEGLAETHQSCLKVEPSLPALAKGWFFSILFAATMMKVHLKTPWLHPTFQHLSARIRAQE